MQTTTLFTTALVLLAQVSFLTALDLDVQSVKEPCFPITKTVPINMDWANTVQTWYYPLMSRLELLWTGTEVTGKGRKDLPDDKLYYDSCITINYGETTYKVNGFGGLQKIVDYKPLKGIESFTQSVDGKMVATSWSTLTDNSTFIFYASCTVDNEMTWGVVSSKKELSKETTKTIHDHAEALGFKREFFTGLRYDMCDEEGRKAKLDCKSESETQ